MFSVFQNFFGEGCNEICSCQNGGSCHHITGDCICPPGVKGLRCEDGCPAGYFGTRCDRLCETACSTGFCDRTFGFCQCQPGFFGSACDKPCPSNTWGLNCRERWVVNILSKFMLTCKQNSFLGWPSLLNFRTH